MKQTLAMLGVLAAVLLARPARASDDSQDDATARVAAECVHGCQDDEGSCEKICKQQAGAMAGRCLEACKAEERSCEKDCQSGGSSDSSGAADTGGQDDTGGGSTAEPTPGPGDGP